MFWVVEVVLLLTGWTLLLWGLSYGLGRPRGSQSLGAVLDDILAEFRTDSGSTLRDTVNTLADAAREQRAAAEALSVNVAQANQLAARLVVMLDRLTGKVERSAATGDRVEAAQAVVADDLAAAHVRADAVESDEAGAAADAATRSEPAP